MKTSDFKAFCNRRARRMANQGLGLESFVSDLLAKMLENKEILSFEKHAHNSTDDRGGKDFTVVKLTREKEESRSFGVTISMNSWHRSKMFHTSTPQFCFPIGTKPETIRKRILELFEN